MKVEAAGIVGRESELATLDEFLGSDRQAFVLEGGPGIGKTTLWEAGLELAAQRGLRVLRARPSDASAQLSFMAVADLLDEIDTAALTRLPAPQRHALEVALLRAEPTGAPPEPRAIALGLLNALRSLAADEPLLVCVDDIQWLDGASADALTFATRRLESRAVRFLLAKRSGSTSALEAAVAPLGLERLPIEPLSLGAVRRILFERLRLTLTRPTLRRLFEVTGGSPLFVLELGRTLAERGPVEASEDIPVPAAVEELLGTRVASLAAPLRRLLLGLALSGDLRVAQVTLVAGSDVLEEALAIGIVALDGDRVRPAHPLLAAAAKEHSLDDQRRQVHLALAEAVDDPELRARHLALATQQPDAALASTLQEVAARASARGAVTEAVDLADHALRLTPAHASERTERVMALAKYLDVAGFSEILTELLTSELATLPAQARARAHLHLAGIAADLATHAHHLEQAFDQSHGDPLLRARVLAAKAELTAGIEVARIEDAEAWALEAVHHAGGAGEERPALYALALVRALRGRAVDDLEQRFHAASDAPFELHGSVERIAAIRQSWRGETSDALAVLMRLLSLADERAEQVSYTSLRLHVCEVQLRIGDTEAASRLLDEWEQESSEDGAIEDQIYARCRALHAALRGTPDDAESWANQAIAMAEASGLRWDLLEALRARGIVALLAHEPQRAVETLRAVWSHTEREGVEDPGTFPVAPELVEALVEIGELEEASTVTERLAQLAEEQDHPWGLATAHRCRGLIQLAAKNYVEDAVMSLEQAAAAYEQLGLLFDRARCLLSLGRAQRRHRKWGAARSSLNQAAAAFDALGSPGWAEQARSELERIGGRKPRPSGKLTPSEQQVAELAANGLANKEIAQELFVTVPTVEAHLSKAYAKLGIRSRSQLARRLSDGAQGQ